MLAKLRRAASAVPLVLRLRFQSTPEAVAAFVLSHDLIKPLQVPSELYHFANIIAALRPEKVMEIGTFKGGTLCVLCRLSSPTADIISVDLPSGRFGGGYGAIYSLLYRSFCKYLSDHAPDSRGLSFRRDLHQGQEHHSITGPSFY